MQVEISGIHSLQLVQLRDVMSLPVDCVFQARYHEYARVVYGIAAKHARFMVTCSEVRNLPEVTSRLISKLYKL